MAAATPEVVEGGRERCVWFRRRWRRRGEEEEAFAEQTDRASDLTVGNLTTDAELAEKLFAKEFCLNICFVNGSQKS